MVYVAHCTKWKALVSMKEINANEHPVSVALEKMKAKKKKKRKNFATAGKSSIIN